jgi:hypothetical protein
VALRNAGAGSGAASRDWVGAFAMPTLSSPARSIYICRFNDHPLVSGCILGAAVLERPDSGVLAAVVVADTVLYTKEL